jgi:hypothetical protein
VNEDDRELAAWVAACCIIGALALVLVSVAVKGCA